MDKKTKFKGLAALILVLIALGGVAYLLYIVFNTIIFDAEFDFFTVFMLILVIALPISIAVSLIKGVAKNTTNSSSENQAQESSDGENVIKPRETNEWEENKTHSLQLDPWGKNHEKPSSADKTSGKPKVKGKAQDPRKIIPLVIFIVIIIILFIYQAGGLPSLGLGGSSNPVGRWVYDMEVGEVVGGIENLTDYWYMDFSEDGTVIIGIKNDGFAEATQGSGTWSVSNGVIHVDAMYNWSQPLVLDLKIKNNQLVDADTGEGSGYFRE